MIPFQDTQPSLPTRPCPARWSVRAAAVVTLLVAGACREKPRPGGPTSKPSEPVPVAANEGRRIAVDAQDHPRAPACLPKSNKDGAWVKVRPVEVFSPTELTALLLPEEAERCAPFRLALAARCTYALPRGDRPFDAFVMIIETLSPEDAYGILTCLADSTELFKIGGETRVNRSNGLTLHIWQGRYYIRLQSKDSAPLEREELIRLALNIANCIGREDPPQLLSALPKESLIPSRHWLVRHLSSLPADRLQLATSLDGQRSSRLLGLGKDTLVCVGCYETPGAARPNTVWVARYPTIKAANDAYARYSRAIAQDGDAHDASTNLLPPQGEYLVGTWSAEEESMQYVLPRVLSLLPQG